MRNTKGFLCIVVLTACVLLLQGCGAFALPPLPTPTKETPPPSDPPAVTSALSEVLPPDEPEQTAEPAPSEEPESTPEPTPTPEDPDQPHLTIYDQTLPERIKQYDVFSLEGVVETDRGSIIELRGAILDSEGRSVQESALYQPYDIQVSLAGTVNADLRFGVLEPGKYVYQVIAVAENNDLRTREMLIDQPFEIVAE